MERGTRLDSWKEIASYLRRDVTTVQRWEKREGLPVHRHQHDRQGTVFAYAHELDAWLRRRLQSPAPAPTADPRQPPERTGASWLLPALASALAAALATLAVVLVRDAGAPVPGDGLHPRFRIYPPPLESFNSLAVSPDGRAIVYGSGPLLNVRQLESVESRPVPGTQGAYDPFFSPDGTEIAYFAGQDLKRVAVTGGRPATLAPARRARGGTWSRSGAIVFAAERGEVLMRVPATGGEPQPIRRAGERSGWKAVRWPAALPDGERFLYFVRSDDPDVQGVYVGDLRRTDASRDTRVLAADSNVFFGAGHLAFVRRGELFAQPFDLASGRTKGTAFPVVERIDQDPYDDGFAIFALSPNGVLVYRGGVTPDRQLRWFDRAGRQTGAVDGPGEFRDLAISRDGRRLAIERMDERHGTRDIWVHEVDRPARLRLTFTSDEDGAPVWAPDADSLVFAGLRERTVRLLQVPAAGGAETVLLDVLGVPVDWSPDGSRIAMEVEVPGEGVNLVFFETASRRLTPYLATPSMEREAQFSPDGRFVAYSSSESGQREIYVEPVPRDGRRWKVSDDFGREPRWRGDGRELFYLGRENTLMAVPVAASGRDLRFGRPEGLFVLRIRGSDVRFHYAAAPAGDRFLVATVVEDVPGTPLNVWERWLRGR